MANETKETVSKEEAQAKKQAEESVAIQQDAEKDLAEALPALVRHSLLAYAYYVCFLFYIRIRTCVSNFM